LLSSFAVEVKLVNYKQLCGEHMPRLPWVLRRYLTDIYVAVMTY